MKNQGSIKPIAIHLPQYHPFKENDAWWGKGFTEWTNVTKAQPLFKGHYQPHLPANLGYYDLRLEETRIAQAEMAKRYGIYGFCYYHYWFNGKRLMNKPVDEILRTRKPDFPFMLCWANENWTRTWDGAESNVLIAQDYSDADDLEHIQFLCKVFADDRYIKIDGKPFFVIYKPFLLPDLKRTIDTWRTEVVKAGFPGLVIGVMNSTVSYQDVLAAGSDYVIDFQPNFSLAPTQEFAPLSHKLKNKLFGVESAYYNHKIVSYKKYVDHIIHQNYYRPKLIPGITPGWDNTARKRKNGFIFKDANPTDYGRWLQHIIDEFNCEQPYLFINAWNEWAEGNHLEPDHKWGTRYLEETQIKINNS